MPKAHKQTNNSAKFKRSEVPQAKKKAGKDIAPPKFRGLQNAVDSKQVLKGKGKAVQAPHLVPERNLSHLTNLSSLSSADIPLDSLDPSSAFITSNPLDPSLTIRDSSARAFARELKKVIERSDVIIQVLDARDPEGTRSRWVEEEVRKREGVGKRIVGVINKIDLVPRSNLEAWLRHLKQDFPVMPFKSSTQSQRHNLSQNAIALPGSSNNATKNPLDKSSTTDANAPLPTTAASLGAPALLQLLKKYAASSPHSTLTVGVIGYPNVGKSSLINSLKRSRACAVAAMPGKTRVVQEVVLDKGVKVLDSPGVVLEDFDRSINGREESEDEKRKRLGEVMLRNCVKVEEIEDPIAPVEAILGRVEEGLLREMYGVPAWKNVTEFLVGVALVRGRLGKGGIPDLPAAATSVLRDWNAGKIPFFTTPPKTLPSTAKPSANDIIIPLKSKSNGAADSGMDIEPEVVAPAQDAILTGLGEAFDLDGLFASGGGEWAGEEGERVVNGENGVEEVAAMPIDEEGASLHRTRTNLSQSSRLHSDQISQLPIASSSKPTDSRLFSSAEQALLPQHLNPLDPRLLKKRAKQAAKNARSAERKERAADEDMFDAAALFGSMTVTAPKRPEVVKKKKKVEKVEKKRKGEVVPVTFDEEAEKEMEFMSFLNHVGADDDGDDDMEL